jgi:hypothetical protein
LNRLPFLFILLALLFCCSKAQKTVFPEKGTISGKVTDEGEPVSGAFILLLEGSEIGGEVDLKNLMATNSDGKYKIRMVDSGTHWVAAVKDEEGNHIYDPASDPIGWYGKDTLGVTIPQSVTVQKGEDVKGIDITILYLAGS